MYIRFVYVYKIVQKDYNKLNSGYFWDKSGENNFYVIMFYLNLL